MTEETEVEAREPIAHHNVVVIRTQDVDEMDTLVTTPALRGFIWRRLNDTYALADPTAIVAIRERLEAAGLSITVGELPASEHAD